MNRIGFLIETVVASLLWLALLIHMSICFVAAGPDNYIKLQHDQQINNYVTRMFGQNWGFFAPDPTASNLILVVRGADVRGVTTQWINVSDALTSLLQTNRLTSYELIATSVSNALGSFENNLQSGKLKAIGLDKDLYQEVFFRIMTRTGASVLESTYPDRQFTSIQVGVVEDVFPRFTHRLDADNKSTERMAVYQWMPMPKVVPIR